MKIIQVSSKNLFFSSDLHFFHSRIIQFCNRPCADVEEMNEMIIENWNKVIPKDGVVFLLGDISWKGAAKTEKLIERLNGKIILINGNHDSSSVSSMFEENYEMLGLNVKEDDGSSTHVHLSHFPLLEWNSMKHGSIHLHGHCHGSMDELDKNNTKRMDVGLDSHNMFPISWEEVKEILNNRELPVSE